MTTDCRCGKPPELCICESLPKLSPRRHVLLLQHPQEPDKDLGSAKITNLCIPDKSTLAVGLSWANLAKALGKAATPQEWAVLYLGSGPKRNPKQPEGSKREVVFVDKHGMAMTDDDCNKLERGIQGIVVLDGTWSQAKTLWWRNAWLLKLKRIVLQPRSPSRYKELRKEPRRECLSTIESVACALRGLSENPAIPNELELVFQKLLDKKRTAVREAKEARKAARATPPPSEL